MASLSGLPTALHDVWAYILTALAGLVLMAVLLRAAARRSGDGKLEDSAEQQRRRRAAARREPRGYTRAEVAEHASEGDLWLLIRNQGSGKMRVYDVSEYADQHPGGEAIYAHAGGDATEGFHGPQHPSTVFDLLEEYCIGWLREDEGER